MVMVIICWLEDIGGDDGDDGDDDDNGDHGNDDCLAGCF